MHGKLGSTRRRNFSSEIRTNQSTKKYKKRRLKKKLKWTDDKNFKFLMTFFFQRFSNSFLSTYFSRVEDHIPEQSRNVVTSHHFHSTVFPQKISRDLTPLGEFAPFILDSTLVLVQTFWPKIDKTNPHKSFFFVLLHSRFFSSDKQTMEQFASSVLVFTLLQTVKLKYHLKQKTYSFSSLPLLPVPTFPLPLFLKYYTNMYRLY